MPITKSAQKALKGSLQKKVFNDRRNRAMKQSIKKIEKLVKENKNPEAKKLLRVAYQAIDKAVKRGIIKKNTASRKKSRLSRITKS